MAVTRATDTSVLAISWAIRDWWKGADQRTRIALLTTTVFAAASLFNLAATIIRTPVAAPSPAATIRPTAPPLAAEAAPAEAGRTWSVVRIWQGSGVAETEAFTVGQHWRVDHLFDPGQGGALQVFIYHADGRLLMNVAANTTTGGANTSFWAGPGTYFLKINAMGDWKVAVQDLR